MTSARTIPIYFRARDFDKNGNLFIGSAVALSQGFGGKFSINKNTVLNHCRNCSGVRKCQYLIIPKPYNQTFASKLMQDAMMLKIYDVMVGNTSRTSIRHLMHKETILISFVSVSVHWDKNTRKPTPICTKTKNNIIENAKKCSKEQMKHFNEANSKMKTAVKRLLSINKQNNDKILCWSKMFLRCSDIDQYNHVNQSVYGEYIENTLHKYDKQYHDGKLWINEIGVTYDKEMKINVLDKTYCVVSIHYDNFDSMNRTREIIGNICQSNKVCAQFRVILKERYQNKL
eukprot:189967_1